MLKLIDLVVRRGPATIVAGLDLDIAPGRPFWIVGPNGAGKSSLLRVLAGLDPPAAGVVLAAPAGRLLYFHSEMALPAWSTVSSWERLVVSLTPGPAARTRTPLWPPVRDGRRVGRLSTGERKRLLLDALFRSPGPLLLDEPFEHLSPEARSALAELVEGRARTEVVVVATNEATDRVELDGGLRLEAGRAERVSGARDGVRP